MLLLHRGDPNGFLERPSVADGIGLPVSLVYGLFTSFRQHRHGRVAPSHYP